MSVDCAAPTSCISKASWSFVRFHILAFVFYGLRDPWFNSTPRLESCNHVIVSGLDFALNIITVVHDVVTSTTSKENLKSWVRVIRAMNSFIPHSFVCFHPPSTLQPHPITQIHLLFNQCLHGDAASQPFICVHPNLIPQVSVLLCLLTAFFLKIVTSPLIHYFPPLLHPSSSSLPFHQLLWLKNCSCLQEACGFSQVQGWLGPSRRYEDGGMPSWAIQAGERKAEAEYERNEGGKHIQASPFWKGHVYVLPKQKTLCVGVCLISLH